MRNSHIFPDFFIRSLQEYVPKGNNRTLEPHSIAMSGRPGFEGGLKQRGYWEKRLGIKETLLCDACERHLNRYETYLREHFYGQEPGRLNKRELGVRIQGAHPTAKGLIEVREMVFDTKFFKLFVLSLLWRCSVASGEFFKLVSLGERHENRLANALLSDDPGGEESYPFRMFDLRDGDSGLVDFFQQPSVTRHADGCRVCQIVIGGFLFQIHLVAEGHRLGIQLMELCLRDDGTFRIPVVHAGQFLANWARILGITKDSPDVV